MTTPTYPVSTIAKLFSISERRVQQLAKEGIIPKNTKGKYELAPCISGYINYLREKGENKDNSSANETYLYKTRLLKGQADKLELEIAELKKDLVPAEHVFKTWSNRILRCRSLLLNMPDKLAYQVSTITDPREAEELITGAIEEALAELASDDIIADIERDNGNNLEKTEEE